MLRQALARAARSVLACAGPSSSMAAPAAQLEASTRTLVSLVSLRGFTQQSWAAQAAAPSAAQQAPAAAAAAAAAAAPAPWTPTRELQKRKALPKRMQHLLTVSGAGGRACSGDAAAGGSSEGAWLPAAWRMQQSRTLLLGTQQPHPSLPPRLRTHMLCRRWSRSARRRWRWSCSGPSLGRATSLS